MPGTLRGITDLPDFELIGIDVFEFIPIMFLDCALQVMDRFRRHDFNSKGVHIVEANNQATKRDFDGHVRRHRDWAHVSARDVVTINIVRHWLTRPWGRTQLQVHTGFSTVLALSTTLLRTSVHLARYWGGDREQRP